jgi:hypothetical protein
MKTSSAKSKGRRLQQWVRCLLISTFDLESDDVHSRSMGAGGEDVMLSPKARAIFPYSIECKNVEKLNLWESWKQAEANAGGYEPLLIIKRNRQKPLAVVDAEHFIGALNEDDSTPL